MSGGPLGGVHVPFAVRVRAADVDRHAARGHNQQQDREQRDPAGQV